MPKTKKKNPRILHIGKKVPKGFKELGGGIHLGRGLWVLPMEKVEVKE